MKDTPMRPFDPEPLLRECFDVAVAAAQPAAKLREFWENEAKPWLDEVAPDRKTVWVYGAGKAAASMAAALEAVTDEPINGFVITRRGYQVPTKKIQVIEAAHPVPDEDGQRAAKRLLAELQQVPAGDAVLALVSGGGSSLLSVPVKEVPFVDLQHLNRSLLSCGAPIEEMNVVRKHVTMTLGGRLAAACSVPICQVLISDVPGDDPAYVASGPFTGDPSTFQDAATILKRWSVQPAHSVQRYIDRGCRGEVPETPKPNANVFARVKTVMLASNAISLEAVGSFLTSKGYAVLSLGDALQGEAKDVAQVVASITSQISKLAGGWPKPPVALISGGECTVTLSEAVMRQAKGGRNSEFVLAFSFYLAGLMRGVDDVVVSCLAADTDGTDGIGGHAGAFLLPGDDLLARQKGMAPQWYLDQHNSYGYFESMGRLLNTGPTQTNVNDLRIVLIDPK